jgi:hypothetical protein
MSGRSWAIARPWLVIAFVLVAITLPLVLEKLGVLAPTWETTDRGLLVWSTIFDPKNGAGTTLAIVFGHVALLTVITFYVMTISRGRALAQHRVHVQAWHLQQLLPRGAGRLPSDHEANRQRCADGRA